MKKKIVGFLNVYAQRDLWLLLLLGFSSGIPFLLILSTFSYWLNELNFCEAAVSLFTAVSIPYSLKAFWAPYVEQVSKKIVGLVSQILLMAALCVMGSLKPDQMPLLTAFIAIFVCFCSATQDIVIDGLRIDRFQDAGYGAAASMSGIGFHLGKLASGSGALYLAHWYDWERAYQIMSFGIVPGFIALLWFKEEKKIVRISMSPLKDSFIALLDQKKLWVMLGFIFCFKISDAVIQGTAATFFYQIGLSKIEFANYTKLYGTFWMIIGATFGGIAIQWFNIYTATFTAGLMQVCACLLFAVQAKIGYDPFVLSISIGCESFSSGIVTCSLIAMISHFVKAPYSASHYTMLYSFGSLSRVVVSVCSGYLAYHFGWVMLYSTLSLFFIPMIYFMVQLKGNNNLQRFSL